MADRSWVLSVLWNNCCKDVSGFLHFSEPYRKEASKFSYFPTIFPSTLSPPLAPINCLTYLVVSTAGAGLDVGSCGSGVCST